MHWGRRFLGTTVLVAGMSAGLVACGHSNRSAAAVCHVWATNGLALHNQFQGLDNQMQSNPNGNLATALGSLAAAPSDLAGLMTKMASVAPSDVESAFQAVAQAFNDEAKNEAEALTNPLGAVSSGLVDGLSTGAAYEQVNRFLSQNCSTSGQG